MIRATAHIRIGRCIRSRKSSRSSRQRSPIVTLVGWVEKSDIVDAENTTQSSQKYAHSPWSPPVSDAPKINLDENGHVSARCLEEA
jgi:hypothetical protein